MTFLQRLLVAIQDFLESIFSSSSPEYKKKHQLRILASQVRSTDPPLFRDDGYLLPSFPSALLQIFQFLLPIREVLESTTASPDKRVSERYRDYLLELAMSQEQRATRKNLTLSERAKALIAQPLSPERVIEDQAKQFSAFLKGLDNQTMRQAAHLLEKLDALADFCAFDFNSFFAFFDPAFQAHVGQSTTVDTPSFNPVEVVQIVPQLLDLYYLLSKVDLSQSLCDVLSLLESKKTNQALSDDIRNRTARIFQALIWLLQKKISPGTVLAIIRLVKEDPDYKPEQPQYQTDYLAMYKERLTDIFHSDSRKVLQEKQNSEIEQMVKNTFGDRELEQVKGYNETTNTLLGEFSVFSLEWIKPLQIIKTFARHYFEPHFKQVLRSVIVEGYFNNRTLQSSLSSAFYYCDSVCAKFNDFEALFDEKQPCSLKILTGYITEMEKGMDFEKPLQKMVENMNGHAKTFIQEAVTQYSEVFNFSVIMMEDNKKPVPDYITNIRTLVASTKNIDSYRYLEQESGVFRNFLEIMKKYAIVGTLSVPASLSEKTEN